MSVWPVEIMIHHQQYFPYLLLWFLKSSVSHIVKMAWKHSVWSYLAIMCSVQCSTDISFLCWLRKNLQSYKNKDNEISRNGVVFTTFSTGKKKTKQTTKQTLQGRSLHWSFLKQYKKTRLYIVLSIYRNPSIQ